MDEALRDLVKLWFVKADHDLKSAKTLSSSNDPLLDTAIYHCQQAAEKALKGFLAFHNQPLEKTHDIHYLITLACQFEAKLNEWQDAGDTLTPYATEYRYPSDFSGPGIDEFNEALGVAEKLVTFVASLLPADICYP